jgi:hypothetical protein
MSSAGCQDSSWRNSRRLREAEPPGYRAARVQRFNELAHECAPAPRRVLADGRLGVAERCMQRAARMASPRERLREALVPMGTRPGTSAGKAILRSRSRQEAGHSRSRIVSVVFDGVSQAVTVVARRYWGMVGGVSATLGCEGLNFLNFRQTHSGVYSKTTGGEFCDLGEFRIILPNNPNSCIIQIWTEDEIRSRPAPEPVRSNWLDATGSSRMLP